MSASSLRVLGVLVGDIKREPSARTKYGLLFEALGRRFDLVGVHDATLRGFPRLLNALRVAHPNMKAWRERYWKNIPAFCARSRRVADRLRRLKGQVDVILQVGVLFDARWDDDAPPSVIYTDYTARLSAQNPAAGRSPFSQAERERWIALERQALHRASHVCSRSRLVRQSLVTDYGLAPGRVSVVGGGVNFVTLPALAERRCQGGPTALFLGKEWHRKGGDLVLQAFAQARAQVPGARLIVVAAEPLPPLGLEAVEVVAPTWDRAAVEALYRRADVFVLPSRLETWGDVLLEAMAFGLPCVGVAGQPMEEIIQHGRTGFVVPPGDVSALAAALARLLNDPSLRREMGWAGRRRVEAEYTWPCVVERLALALEAACHAERRN